MAKQKTNKHARQRAAELANDADLRLSPPRTGKSAPGRPTPKNGAVVPCTLPPVPQDERLPPPGSLLTRVYKGQTYEVKVLKLGFEHQGQVFLSLSALAKKITGSHCNGFWFFQLGRHSKGANS